MASGANPSEQKLSIVAKGATATLARFTSQLKFEDLPRAVVEHVKRLALDAIGCSLYGTTLPWTRIVIDMIAAEGGSPRASIFGTRIKTSPSQAVLATSTAGHAFESDDMHKASLFHPGSICLPVALACAEARGGRNGRDVITSMVAGYEVGPRVGMAATMGLFFRGWHPQGTSGTFTAAAAAASMLRLDPEQTLHAIGTAASQASGLMSAQEGSMVKRMHSGRAAQSGVYGALLAERGFTGIVNVLEADFGGFLGTLSDKHDPEHLTDGLGQKWESLQVGFKPFSSVASIHAALDALRQVMRENELSADDIAQVDVRVSTMTHVHCAWEYKAQGVTAAQMNLFFGLAAIAVDDNAFVDQYREERLSDPRILSFIDRIRAHADPEIDNLGPLLRHGAKLEVKTTNGRVLKKEMMNRLGSPENPVSQAFVEEKFRTLASKCLPERQVTEIIETVGALDELESVETLVALLVPRS
jgi:2-methylcitrate dehydratase PrpD